MTLITQSPEEVTESTALAQASEDYPLAAVPQSARKPLRSLAPLLMGFTLTSTTLLAGGAIAPSFRFWPNLAVIIVVSNLMLGLYCAALAYIAYRSGLTTVLMARYSFGNWGSRWVDFLLGITQISGYAITTAFAVQALHQLITLPADWDRWVIILFTYGFCITAYVGYAAMDWLSRLAVPAMLGLIGISITLAGQDLGGWSTLLAIDSTGLTQTPVLRWDEALTIVIATFISGGAQATNWSRFANSGRTAIISTLLGFFGVNGLLVFTGALCWIVYGSEDIVGAMVQQGIVWAGVGLLVLNVWTTQDNTIYAFSVAGANMFRTPNRHLFVLSGATLALGLTWAGIYENLTPYLLILGTIIPPIGGVIMADFWLRRQGQFPPLESQHTAFNWAGILAYAIASGVALLSAQASIGIAPVNGVAIAVLLYWGLIHVLPAEAGGK
ncbi:MAG: cytosine permease [Leptolyngbyaceae cyanobacterium MO_188.B28]|nr:cytosine permease [Leptolyngbyaceae cyanobacterium MO_188.B28]